MKSKNGQEITKNIFIWIFHTKNNVSIFVLIFRREIRKIIKNETFWVIFKYWKEMHQRWKSM